MLIAQKILLCYKATGLFLKTRGLFTVKQIFLLRDGCPGRKLLRSFGYAEELVCFSEQTGIAACLFKDGKGAFL